MTPPNRIYYPTRELYATLLSSNRKTGEHTYQYDKEEPVTGKVTGTIYTPHLSESQVVYNDIILEEMMRKGTIKEVK